MPDQPEKKIFVIDDDKFLLDLYSLKFTKAGYSVATAESTDVALKMLREGYAPDVVLADIVMPGLDGLDMIALVRSERLIPKAAIIMLTNQGASDDVARARKLNVDGYIVKATTIPSEVLAEVDKISLSKSKKA